MKFGPVPVQAAMGGLLAHQVRAGSVALRKGHVLTLEDCAALQAAGVDEVTIARLEVGDIGEDEAARQLAQAVAGAGVRVDPAFTGRANLFAEHAGVFVPDAAVIDAFNALDPGMTLATLPALRRVAAGEMIGTVKIIPFALPELAVARGAALLRPMPLVVKPFVPKRVALLMLGLPGLKPAVQAKTEAVTRARIEALGSQISLVQHLPHERGALEAALAALDPAAFDLLIIFGAAAIADRRDIIPAAIEAGGGRVLHLGMPVDPGNLLLLAQWAGKPVLGAPGCARSPRENGFDWVLARLCADIPVTPHDITRMGVGGLLMEIISRPQPRAGAVESVGAQDIAAIVLAAGRSTRFGPRNKLLAALDGTPMLHTVVTRAQAAGLAPLVVTGHEAEAVRALIPAVQTVHNPDYAEGLASSLRAGVAALPESVGAVLILLGDMPRVRVETLQALLKAARENPAAPAIVPAFQGRRGNPVLVRRTLFPALLQLHGDQGARKLLENAGEDVLVLETGDAGVLMDFDTAAALKDAQ